MPQLDKFTYFTQFFWSCLFFFTLSVLLRFYHWEVKIFCFYLTRPKLQRALALVKGLLLFSFVVRFGCTSYNNIQNFLVDSLCSVLPLDPSSSGWTALLGSSSGSTAQQPAAEQVDSGWTSKLESHSGESSEERVEPDSGASSSGRSNSTRSVNQPQPGEQAMPPARPVVQEAANQGPPYPHDEIIGGDSIEQIQRRLLSQSDFPSANEIELARIRAEDLFEVKVDIIRRMTSLDPEGDWMRQGARALDNPRTSTGEE